MTQYGFFIDLSRCIGCNSCVIACKQWHDIEPGPAKWMRVYQWEKGAYPRIEVHTLPIMCLHCQNPVCADACPNKAIRKEEKYGAVLVDPAKCTGERECFAACPYGAPQYASDSPGEKMSKCNMCIDRLEQGLTPICVLSCSMRALEFGPLDELKKKYGISAQVAGLSSDYASCRISCPAGVDAGGYIKLIAAGKTQEALQLFRESTPFAGVLGRVCGHPCEVECQRGKFDEAVSICSLKRYMADSEYESKRNANSPDKEKASQSPFAKGEEKIPLNLTPYEMHGRGEADVSPFEKGGSRGISPVLKPSKVAVIGSGPAGLSAAYDLRRLGYPVTVFESAPEAGGLMRYGIPEYRLPRNILNYEIRFIEDQGVEIKTDTPVNDLEEVIKQGYQAVFVASGAWSSQKLNVPGEEAQGVIYALDFLKKVNSGASGSQLPSPFSKVVVIGGGSVAMDAARMSLRSGAKEVQVVCLECRDLTSADRMPAQGREIQEAEMEGVIIHSSLGISRILTSDGRVTGVEIMPCLTVRDDAGKFAPRYNRRSISSIEADAVIIAAGQTVDTAVLAGNLKYNRGTVSVDPVTLETGFKGVFAGGDMAQGAADIISAIAAGKQAAVSIDRYLNREDLRKDRLPLVKSAKEKPSTFRFAFSGIEDVLSENSPGIDPEQAIEQAQRCLQCGLTIPSVVFKPDDPKKQVIPWDPEKALSLWQKRHPDSGEALTDIFENVTDVIDVPEGTYLRDRLHLKPKDSEELMTYTTDDE